MGNKRVKDKIQLKSILLEAEELVDTKRAAEYGSFTEIAYRTWALYNTLCGRRLPSEVNAKEIAQNVAKFMICFKLAREGVRAKRDNRVDACGYMKILDSLIEEKEI